LHSTRDGGSIESPWFEALFTTHLKFEGGGAVAPVHRSKLIAGLTSVNPGVATKASCTALLKSFSDGTAAMPETRPEVGTLPVPGSATTPDGYSMQKRPAESSVPAGGVRWMVWTCRTVVAAH
jgi:hypothetical protein